MNWKLAVAALALGTSFVTISGCAVDTTSDEDAEGDAEEASTSEQELSSYANKLVGAYTHSAGAMRPPTFEGMAFNADGTYFADVDTGIRCITAPCPSHVRLEGKFTATKNYVRLYSKPGVTHSFYGRYKYTLSSTGRLSLSRTGSSWANWWNRLGKQTSYCREDNDCYAQNIIHPMCMGQFDCTAQNACKWSCTPWPPVNTIWPADASTLVVKTNGGGFTPPPAPGSTCAMGAQKYTLNVATRKLDWTFCDFTDWQTPMHNKTGSRTLTVAELGQVNDAMNNVVLAQEDICGADKPMLEFTVSSASQGTKTFRDSFYSCMGGSHTYVDNIDGVFSVMRDLSGNN